MSITKYRQYRRLRLRNAWNLADMDRTAARVALVVVVLALIGAALGLLVSEARAIERATEQRSAATIVDQQQLITKMTKFLNACLGERAGAFWIGERLVLCNAVDTGERR